MELNFNDMQIRNLDTAPRLKGRQVVVAGGGATGSNIVAHLILAGLDVDVIDHDVLVLENIPRIYADPQYIGKPKAFAVAKTIRRHAAKEQRVHGIHVDLELLSDDEIRRLLRGAALVVLSTGSDLIDRRINRLARELGIATVVPSMWPGRGAVVGDVLISPWHRPNGRTGCLECLRPNRGPVDSVAQAQLGLMAEVGLVAAATSLIVIGLLLPDSQFGAVVARQLHHGSGYFLIPRFIGRAVINRQVVGCPTCGSLTAGSIPVDPSESFLDWSRRLLDQLTR